MLWAGLWVAMWIIHVGGKFCNSLLENSLKLSHVFGLISYQSTIRDENMT